MEQLQKSKPQTWWSRVKLRLWVQWLPSHWRQTQHISSQVPQKPRSTGATLIKLRPNWETHVTTKKSIALLSLQATRSYLQLARWTTSEYGTLLLVKNCSVSKFPVLSAMPLVSWVTERASFLDGLMARFAPSYLNQASCCTLSTTHTTTV